MAEVEYGGVKLTGSKLFMIIPLVSMLGGGLWGGFEFYKDYMDYFRKVFEHVLCRHLEHLTALLIHQERSNKIMEIGGVIVRHSHHQIDDRHIRRHGHETILASFLVCVRYAVIDIYASSESMG